MILVQETYLESYSCMLKGDSGTPHDSGKGLSHNNGRYFSTWDRDNDGTPPKCAEVRRGAWWYTGCGFTNLNGLYVDRREQISAPGIMWWPLDSTYTLKNTRMSFRPRNHVDG